MVQFKNSAEYVSQATDQSQSAAQFNSPTNMFWMLDQLPAAKGISSDQSGQNIKSSQELREQMR